MADLPYNKDNVLNLKFLELLMQNPGYLEMLPCAAFFIKDDPDLTIICGNTSFYTLFGCTKESMRLKYANRLGTLICTESIRGMDILRHKNIRFPAELKQHIKKGKNEGWIYTRVIRFQYEGDSAYCCVAFDITQKEREHQSFIKYKEQMRMICEQISFDTFEYNISSGEVKIQHAREFLLPEQMDLYLARTNFPEMLIASGLVHPKYSKVFADAFDAVKRGDTKAVCELRMRSLSGEFVWARFILMAKQPAGLEDQYAVGILENINHQKEMSIQYLNETQFYQAILAEKSAFAQVDVTMDRCTRFGGIWNLYNEIINTMTYSALIEEFINKVVHPEDRKHYLELMQRDNFIESLNNGVDQLGCEFRRIVEQNKMMWMELKVHLFREPFTGHVLALVYIKNIDAKKKQELALLHDSERDHLTNIFNKKMAESSIQNYLKWMDQREVCAFMILDMDDFKLINDTYGHKTGDQVIIRFAELLSRTFRRDDIIGRFGGDEFIIFLKKINSKEKVQERLDHLYEQLKKMEEPKISCSIGLSMVSQGDPYEQIFNQADIALYDAKSEGKGRYVFYKDNSKREYPAPVKSRRESHPKEVMIENKFPLEEVSFSSFLSEQGDMAYLVDPFTFTLICGNKAFYDRIGMTEAECVGIKCYEAIHKRTSPCPFCSKANWSTDKFYLWRNLNAALEQEFLIKNKLVQWKEREVLLAISIDISNNKSIVDSMENKATESHSIISGIQHMAEADTLNGAMSSALETIGYFFRADAVRFWELKDLEEGYQCTGVWSKTKQEDDSGDMEVNAWLQGRKWDQPVLIESPEAMLCYSYDMYLYMKRNNIINQRWVQLKDGEKELGCIAVLNISSNFQNVAFLESFLIFVAIEYKKRKRMESILYSNNHDPLTDLLNRNSFERYIREYQKDQISEIGVLMANFDNLKGVNRTNGFLTGNFYLKQFAEMLRNSFPCDEVFRLSGDEFLVITVNVGRMDLEARIKKLKTMVKENGTFTVSVGYSWDNIENDLSVLIEQSTEAMMVEKKRHYDTNPISSDGERRRMLSELMTELEQRKFEVYLQPKVELSNINVIGAEALIRYRHQDLGIITPDKFISVFEKNNMIRYIDLFVFEETCRILDDWKQAGILLPIISLNFSRLTLLERDILSCMERIISQYDVERRYIEIEITESMANMGKSILYQAARELYDAGYHISLDDFGTKYTNLSILADIDFSMLKLDKSLIGTLVDQNSNQIIVKNVIAMCKDLGIDVIAEGVETKDQEDVLRNLKCNLGQGYLYGKPMPVKEFNEKYIFID